NELPIRGEDLQTMVAAVDDDEISVRIAYQAGRPQQLAVTASRLAPRAHERAVAVKHRYGVGPFVRHVHRIGAVDRDAEWPGRASFSLAPLEELGQQLLLAGGTQLHPVHP